MTSEQVEVLGRIERTLSRCSWALERIVGPGKGRWCAGCGSNLLRREDLVCPACGEAVPPPDGGRGT